MIRDKAGRRPSQTSPTDNTYACMRQRTHQVTGTRKELQGGEPCGQCRGSEAPCTEGTHKATQRRAPCAEGTLFQHRGRARHQSGTVNKHTHYRGNEQHRGAALEPKPITKAAIQRAANACDERGIPQAHDGCVAIVGSIATTVKPEY